MTCLRLTRAAQAGDVAEVERTNELLLPVWELFKAHSSFRAVVYPGKAARAWEEQLDATHMQATAKLGRTSAPRSASN